MLGLALEEAQRAGSVPRTEHILLAMVRYGSGLGPEILDECGVLAEMRQAVFERLGAPPEVF